jgi:hypothetical protein
MKQNLIATLSIALAAVSCSLGAWPVQTRSLPSPNPTTYRFAFSAEEICARALEAFSIEHQIDQPVFGSSTHPSQIESIFAVECATNALFGAKLFRDPANANDIYLHTFGTPFVVSSVYRGRDGGLPFIAVFHLHLTSAGSNTTVTVTASDTQVVNGTKFGVGPCGPGQGWNNQKVRPTTVEEYSILRYLGNYLGETNMPAVGLPAQ